MRIFKFPQLVDNVGRALWDVFPSYRRSIVGEASTWNPARYPHTELALTT